jgi:glyoxylase-like metal-dependent hydrolase (beta-lactamase superfamily II)
MCFGMGCGASALLHVKGLTLDKNLRVWLGGGGNSTVLLHGRSAFVVDVKLGDYALGLRNNVERDLGREVERIMLTHAHIDHAGGLWAFPNAGAVLVHPNTRARLEKGGVKARFVEVEKEVDLLLGGEEVQVLNLGSGHTDGDLVAYFPKRKLLIAGDLFNTAAEPHLDEGLGGSLLGVKAALENMLTLDFERVVPGHGEVTDRAALEHTLAYLTALQTAVEAARAKGLDEEATVREVKLGDEFSDIHNFLGVATREKNVRRMWKGLAPLR